LFREEGTVFAIVGCVCCGGGKKKWRIGDGMVTTRFDNALLAWYATGCFAGVMRLDGGVSLWHEAEK